MADELISTTLLDEERPVGLLTSYSLFSLIFSHLSGSILPPFSSLPACLSVSACLPAPSFLPFQSK